MTNSYLEFERPIAELTLKIEELSDMDVDSDINIAEEVEHLHDKRDKLVEQIYSNLTRPQICQLSRHPDRPYVLDYIPLIFDSFQEMHGDRALSDDGAIVGGIAQFRGHSVIVVGHQKGRDTKEKLKRNFGMPRAGRIPQGTPPIQTG